ncbi:Cilia- and flagella-associated protein 45 [Orchesella cincta]|uniref:Cilia- and flagella-associated protein 45 n=1 Tax=Orchesella cincta TaxID=48709 RepID=A0A1D2NKM2_ORCCI|nr:Cilia- and flagella-associated protein 45 [Orchesella cincta]
MAMSQAQKRRLCPDKCNPPCDMGSSIVFADALPGVNDTVNRPFGWTEYEAAFRHQYIPDPCAAQRACINPCKPKGVARKPPPRQFVNPRATAPRSNICGLCQKARCCCPIPPPWEECKEKIVVYDPDSVRTLLVHGEVKNEHPFVISYCDYSRILTNAIVKSKEEKEEERQAELRMKQMKIMECREVADEMRLMDKIKFNQSISPEAQADMEEMLCRADKILKEDEPEVRSINKVILAAKVSAIREAQLQEKELIKCEMSEEERRLVELMKQDKKYALIKDPDEELAQVQQKKINLMASIQAQLDEHEAMKFLMKEQKECEREEMKRIWEQQDCEEMTKKALEREKKAKLGLDLIANQMEIVDRKMKEKEMDRELDQRIVEWQKKKAAEEEKLEMEKLAEKKMKELATLKILETQKRVGDAKALRDDLRAKRHQEKQEREWRNHERDTILKRKQDAEQLKKAIHEQIEAKHLWAVYDKIMNVQDTRLDDDKKAAEERRLRNAQYKYDLREQIHQFQLRKVQERKDHFCEGITLRKDMSRREQELKCYMDRKLDELREHSMPEKYIKYIERAVQEELKPDWQKPIAKR